jgi:hypothetical protein
LISSAVEEREDLRQILVLVAEPILKLEPGLTIS